MQCSPGFNKPAFFKDLIKCEIFFILFANLLNNQLMLSNQKLMFVIAQVSGCFKAMYLFQYLLYLDSMLTVDHKLLIAYLHELNVKKSTVPDQIRYLIRTISVAALYRMNSHVYMSSCKCTINLAVWFKSICYTLNFCL